jgi:large subunit ribosomal protein L33
MRMVALLSSGVRAHTLLWIRVMAKKNTILVKLVSTAGTGFFYVKKRNPKKLQEKLSFKKYDPVVRKHVQFNESKMK